VEPDWGATALAHRDAAVADALVSVRADAVILASSAQFNSQSWGTVLPFAVGVGSASGSLANGLTINFLGSVAQAADCLTLTNFTVVRIP
jgi:hypothetical protein